jgi:ABC-type multidrug transport system permease subunit
MLRMVRHELFDLASRPLLWSAVLAFGMFLVHVVGHLAVDDEDVRVAIYQTAADDNLRIDTIVAAESLVQEMSNVKILQPRKFVSSDVTTQALIDNVDIAATRTNDGWRFLVRSRSVLEHNRLVRMAQLLAATVSQQRPWPLIAYEALQSESSDDSEPKWPAKVQISGVTADPGRHARVFVPKTIALLGFFAAFAFACRSMIRDISNNTLPALLVACRGSWLALVGSKVLISALFGLIVLLTLLLFATAAQKFYLKDGLLVVALVQGLGLVTSALLGMTCTLLARTESRIYLIGSGYLVLLVLLSGLIAKIYPNEVILFWLSRTIPLGYAMDVLSEWMFFGLVPTFDSNNFQIMSALLLLSIAAVYGSVLYYRRSA